MFAGIHWSFLGQANLKGGALPGQVSQRGILLRPDQVYVLLEVLSLFLYEAGYQSWKTCNFPMFFETLAKHLRKTRVSCRTSSGRFLRVRDFAFGALRQAAATANLLDDLEVQPEALLPWVSTGGTQIHTVDGRNPEIATR